MAFKPLDLDEEGLTTLDTLEDHDLGLAPTPSNGDLTSLPAAQPNDVAFIGTGPASQCCDSKINLSPVAEEMEVVSHPQQETIEGVQHSHHTTVNGNPRALPPVKSDKSKQKMARPLKFQNMTSEVMADRLRAKESEAAMQARHALRILDAGRSIIASAHATATPARTHGHVQVTSWIEENPFTVGVGSVIIPTPRIFSQNRDRRRSSVASSLGSTMSAIPQPSRSEGFGCRYGPCNSNGETMVFDTKNARKKHETHVHEPEENRPHGCPFCVRRCNYSREVPRHVDRMHPDEPATVVCPECSRLFITSYHLDQHLRVIHPEKWPAVKEARKIAAARSSNASSSTRPLTPSTTSAGAFSNGFGLVTPPPSSGSYQSEFAALPGPSFRK